MMHLSDDKLIAMARSASARALQVREGLDPAGYVDGARSAALQVRVELADRAAGLPTHAARWRRLARDLRVGVRHADTAVQYWDSIIASREVI